VLAENYYSRGPDLAHPVYGSRFRRVRTALYTDGFKLIRSSDGRHELYELSTDPDETRDLAAIQPDRVASLTQRLADFEGSRRSETQRIEQAPLGEREREQLRELGYAQ
jgi:hypothetical protein